MRLRALRGLKGPLRKLVLSEIRYHWLTSATQMLLCKRGFDIHRNF